MSHRSAHAIRASIATANDDHLFVFSVDIAAVLVLVENAPGVPSQEFHREMDTLQMTAFNWQIPRLGGAGCQDNRVKILQKFFRRIIFPDLGIANEFHAL